MPEENVEGLDDCYLHDCNALATTDQAKPTSPLAIPFKLEFRDLT